jgi:uncharacterized damage-inducible protein DinB
MSSTAATACSEAALLADQLRRMYYGPAWHGPALKPLLSGITPEQAAARPIPNAHSIWEIVLHLTAWLRIARERLSASTPRDASPEENWPPAAGSWPAALDALEREQRALERAILACPADRLHQPAPATEPQTFYALFHGTVQHLAYHAGQIALLKKS